MAAAEFGERRRVEVEAKELEAGVAQERLDLRQRQAVLLHIEEQVAAAAQAEEIRRCEQVSERQPGRRHVLPEAADAVGGRSVAALGDERARRSDCRAAALAVEPEKQETARPQQRIERPPTGPRIMEVV